VRSESRCALTLRYVNMVVSIHVDPRGHHFQHLLQAHSDFSNALYNVSDVAGDEGG
jgi:hypothetical protein